MIQAVKNLNLLQKIVCCIDSQTAKDKYSQSNSIKLSLWGYFDAFILVAEDITLTADNDKMLHLKIVHHFLPA